MPLHAKISRSIYGIGHGITQHQCTFPNGFDFFELPRYLTRHHVRRMENSKRQGETKITKVTPLEVVISETAVAFHSHTFGNAENPR